MLLLKGVNLGHSFDYTLFSGLNLDIHSSRSYAILGVSGCGKSTLLHILCTLLPPLEGQVFYGERDIYALSSDERVAICRYDFGIIFQSHYLFKGFSARENIELATILAGREFDADLAARLQIDAVLDNKIGNLSGGQQQRVSIARILSKRPRIIFADEPTGNLDKETANDVMGILFDYIRANDAALVLVTHDRDLAGKCDEIYTIKDQKFSAVKA